MTKTKMLSTDSAFFDDVAGQEFQRLLRAVLEVDPGVEDHRQRDPDEGPRERFFELHFVRLAAEDAEVEGQHAQDEDAEDDPEVRRDDGGRVHQTSCLAKFVPCGVCITPTKRCGRSGHS
jgi:hypothetical protein